VKDARLLEGIRVDLQGVVQVLARRAVAAAERSQRHHVEACGERVKLLAPPLRGFLPGVVGMGHDANAAPPEGFECIGSDTRPSPKHGNGGGVLLPILGVEEDMGCEQIGPPFEYKDSRMVRPDAGKPYRPARTGTR
jgi:hypothetical protein